MIDKSNEIFTIVANAIKEQFNDVTVIGESINTPSKFPTVTLDEISNIPTEQDSRPLSAYALVTYRVQVFSNAIAKRSEARRILAIVDETLQRLNFTCKSMSTLPEIYNSKIYQINANYEAVIKEDGTIFRKY